MRHKILSISENALTPNIMTDVDLELKRNGIKTYIETDHGFSILYVEMKDKEKSERFASPIILARFR